MTNDKKLQEQFIQAIKELAEAQQITTETIALLQEEVRDLTQRIHSLWALVMDEDEEDMEVVIPLKREDRLGHMYN